MRRVWKLWAKALGQKASKSNKESDHVALIRSTILFTYLITNAFIVAGVIRHWNDGSPIQLYYDEVSGSLSKIKKEGTVQTNRNFLYD